MHSHIMPYSLNRIELRGVRRKVVGNDVSRVLIKPLYSLGLFVIRRVIMNEEDTVPQPVVNRQDEIFEKRDIGLMVEIVFRVLKNEFT